MAVLWANGLLAQGREGSKVFFFGNSLVNHISEDHKHTNVPYWVDQMARSAGKSFATDGQWGFLRNFSESLPPVPNWSFDGVRGAWNSDRQGFGDAGFDAVVVTPANFIQYQQPDVPYDGDNPSGESPLGAMLKIFDWTVSNSPATRLYVYEGWADMAGVAGDFPPSNRGLRRYHAFNQGDYHEWYLDLVDQVDATRPDHQVALIPVASILSQLFSKGGALEDLEVDALYTDNAPHGTPTLYFLAAMITYSALYNEAPPDGFSVPSDLHPRLQDGYARIANDIWSAMPEAKPERQVSLPAGDADADPTATAAAPALPQRLPVVLPPSGARPDGVPVLGLGLNGVSDWSTQHPFLDLMKTARGWVGHTESQWGAVSTELLQSDGHLDGDGWPVSIPEGVVALETVLLTDQPEDAISADGRYLVSYDGQADIKLTGRAKRVKYDDGRIAFSYSPGEGLVGVRLTKIDPQDPIRNIRIVHEDHVEMHEAGALFNPHWIETIQDARSIRFMDWMMTNGSPVSGWADRPQMNDATWSMAGVPLEVMIRLANRVGADPWFTLPHMADDDYVRRFAEIVKSDLDPRLKAHVEYSNEVWNQIFPQAVWARDQATELWGESDTGWVQFYGMRAARVMDIFSDVFGEQADTRLVRVVATHTGWPGLEVDILRAPLAYLSTGALPQDSFDAYAVTGYFGYEMGTDEMAPRMSAWLDQSEVLAKQTGEALGLQRVALREYVKKTRFEAAIAPVTVALQEGSLRELTEEIFPYQAGAAQQAGLRLIMYEGGTHVAAHGAQVNDDRLAEFFMAYNYTPEMAKLYELLLAGWVQAGGSMFNAFVDVAPATKWGSWGGLRHLDDRNPRWDMLMAFNAAGPGEWEDRDAAAFGNGITRIAGSGNQRLQGTAHEDVLIGGSGDDTLVGGGGSDILHGGDGFDRALLPEKPEAYTFTRSEGRLIAQGPTGTVRMTAVEELLFEAAAGQVLSVAGL